MEELSEASPKSISLEIHLRTADPPLRGAHNEVTELLTFKLCMIVFVFIQK